MLLLQILVIENECVGALCEASYRQSMRLRGISPGESADPLCAAEAEAKTQLQKTQQEETRNRVYAMLKTA